MEEDETANVNPIENKAEENVTTEVRTSSNIPDDKNLPSKLTENEGRTSSPASEIKNLTVEISPEAENLPSKLEEKNLPSPISETKNPTIEISLEIENPSLKLEEKNLPSPISETKNPTIEISPKAENLPSKLEEPNSSKLSSEEVEDASKCDNPNKEEEYDAKNVHYEGETAIYTDPKSGSQYKYCNETNQWLPKTNVTYGFEDDTHTYTDTDGVKYFWDKDKNAWFPKIDDEFMARYQMNYGFVDNTTDADAKKKEEKKPKTDVKASPDEIEEPSTTKDKSKGVKRKTDPPPTPTWFEMDDQQNTKVYVNNLPTDITEEEFVDLMQKCGLVMRDVQTGKMKIKLYTVPDTDILKGDALCTYIKIESVELALNLLDGYLYRGKRLTVERAKFQMKGAYDPTLKPKKKRRKDKDKIKKMQEKLFDWRPEKMRGERSKHERVVIVKNLFEPSLFDKDVSLILEFQQDLREECGKCGQVKRVVLYDRHPEGVVQITMKEPEEADEVVNLLNGRWFNQRQLTASIWDGKTKFKIAETDAQISQRLETWEEFLESEETADKLKASAAIDAKSTNDETIPQIQS